MNENPSALHYIVREPSVENAAKTPLLMLLHGYGSNEQDFDGVGSLPRPQVPDRQHPRASCPRLRGIRVVSDRDNGEGDPLLHFAEALVACENVSKVAKKVAGGRTLH